MPSGPYYVKGKRVPSVTTISGSFSDKKGLLWWANAVGRGERDCDDQDPCPRCGRRPGKSHDEAARKAADTGTYAHALIEQAVKGVEVDESKFEHLTPEQDEAAARCLEAFNRWRDAYQLEIRETEYGLVSEEHLYGGTLDCLGWTTGKFALVDWKTSKAIYEDYLVQLAGYLILCEENNLPPIEEVHILRIAKSDASFHHHSWNVEAFEPARRFFLGARALYEENKNLKAMLKG